MRIVITDANVLINLAIADGLRLLRDLPDHDFVLPEEVLRELTNESQRQQVEAALAEGFLSVVRLEALEGLELFVELRRVMGAGEASCLALAKGNGWIVASDEKGAFRREASRLVGAAGIITTVDIYVLSIHAGLLTVAQADSAKAILAANRFALPFGSFEELLHE